MGSTENHWDRLLVPDEWWRFIVVGGTCFVGNMVLLYVLTDVAGLFYLVSAAISTGLSLLLGWALNRSWTFRSRSPRRATELSRYVLVNLGSMLATVGMLAGLVSGLGVHYLVANAVTAFFMMFVNFAAHKLWSFAGARADLQ